MNRNLCASCQGALDAGVAVVRGGKFRAAPGVSTPPAPRPAGPLFYSGMVVGTLLSGLAFTWPDHAVPVFLSFACATFIYSRVTR